MWNTEGGGVDGSSDKGVEGEAVPAVHVTGSRNQFFDSSDVMLLLSVIKGTPLIL
jgi:hypothetical protein